MIDKYKKIKDVIEAIYNQGLSVQEQADRYVQCCVDIILDDLKNNNPMWKENKTHWNDDDKKA